MRVKKETAHMFISMLFNICKYLNLRGKILSIRTEADKPHMKSAGSVWMRCLELGVWMEVERKWTYRQLCKTT